MPDADILELIAPLSAFAMLDFCRAVYPDDSAESGEATGDARWSAASARLAASHPELAELSGATLRTIHARLLAAYPELGELTAGPSTV